MGDVYPEEKGAGKILILRILLPEEKHRIYQFYAGLDIAPADDPKLRCAVLSPLLSGRWGQVAVPAADECNGLWSGDSREVDGERPIAPMGLLDINL